MLSAAVDITFTSSEENRCFIFKVGALCYCGLVEGNVCLVKVSYLSICADVAGF